MITSKEDKITVRVESYKHNKSLQLTLNWDADIEDWVDAFKTILIHQTFCEDTVKELFEDRWEEYERKAMQDKKEIDYRAILNPTKPWKEPIGTAVGKEVW